MTLSHLPSSYPRVLKIKKKLEKKKNRFYDNYFICAMNFSIFFPPQINNLLLFVIFRNFSSSPLGKSEKKIFKNR